MSKKKKTDRRGESMLAPDGEPAEEEFRVEDRRHWQHAQIADEDAPAGGEPAETEPAKPGILDEYRQRAEEAERKLLEYIEAFKRHQVEQEEVRARLARDVERKVDLKFGELLDELLETLDDLELSLNHVHDVPEAEPLAQGVVMARDRFLATLEKHGVEQVSPEGSRFDPNEAEAVRVDPVDSRDADQVVTETLKAGYKLRDRVIRAAKVAVGRYRPPEDPGSVT